MGASHFHSSHLTCCSRKHKGDIHSGRIPFSCMNPRFQAGGKGYGLHDLLRQLNGTCLWWISITSQNIYHISFWINVCSFSFTSSYFGGFFQTFHCGLIRVCGHSSCLTPQAGDIFQNVSQLSSVSIRHPMLLECPIGYLRCCRPSPFHHNTTPVSHGITSQTLHACVCVCVCVVV